MESDWDRSWGRKVTGGVLVALGVVFLLMNFGYWHYGSIGRYWPAVFFVLGISRLARPTPRHIGAAVFFVSLGLWFFGCQDNWFGMTYQNSWPLFLVASGLNMMLSGLFERLAGREPRADGGDSGHA